ncbi:MAG: hypothetical protein ACPGJS_00710 [Flammeovirgaceae bacterium]
MAATKSVKFELCIEGRNLDNEGKVYKERFFHKEMKKQELLTFLSEHGIEVSYDKPYRWEKEVCMPVSRGSLAEEMTDNRGLLEPLICVKRYYPPR